MRRLSILVLAAVLMAFMSGCGKKPKVEEPVTPTTTTPTKPPETSNPGNPEGDVEHGKLFQLSPVYFDFDKYNIRDDAMATLRNNAQILKDSADMKIRIEGNCDERGTVEYNLALGEKRANSARDYLVSLGINRNRITTISYGKEKPKAMGHDETSWQENRRDDFVEQ